MSWLKDSVDATVIGLVLTVIGLVLTIIALFLAARQSRDAKNQAGVLQDISKALSTRFLGTFPSYLSEVAKLLRKAQRRIDVCIGIPVQGVFSAQTKWMDCQHELAKRCREGIQVSIVCPDKKNRDQITGKHFEGKKENWTAWKQQKHEKIQELLKFHASHLTVEKLTFDEFLGILTDEQDKIVKEGFMGMETTECPVLITTFFWIIDGHEAIFAFLSLSSKAVAHGFHTNDGNLVLALMEMKQQYEQFAESSGRAQNPVAQTDGSAAA